MFTDEFQESLPYDSLKYFVSEINYGGHIFSDIDRRTINDLLYYFYSEEVVENEEYKFGDDPIYKVPLFDTYEEYILYIKEMPFT